MRRFITESRISSVDLSVKDIESLLDVLVYDGVVEKKLPYIAGFEDDDLSDDEGDDPSVPFAYKAVRRTASRLPTEALTEIPCGKCPVRMSSDGHCWIGSNLFSKGILFLYTRWPCQPIQLRIFQSMAGLVKTKTTSRITLYTHTHINTHYSSQHTSQQYIQHNTLHPSLSIPPQQPIIPCILSYCILCTQKKKV